jgi:hypothetical protein
MYRWMRQGNQSTEETKLMLALYVICLVLGLALGSIYHAKEAQELAALKADLTKLKLILEAGILKADQSAKNEMKAAVAWIEKKL